VHLQAQKLEIKKEVQKGSDRCEEKRKKDEVQNRPKKNPIGNLIPVSGRGEEKRGKTKVGERRGKETSKLEKQGKKEEGLSNILAIEEPAKLGRRGQGRGIPPQSKGCKKIKSIKSE